MTADPMPKSTIVCGSGTTMNWLLASPTTQTVCVSVSTPYWPGVTKALVHGVPTPWNDVPTAVNRPEVPERRAMLSSVRRDDEIEGSYDIESTKGFSAPVPESERMSE